VNAATQLDALPLGPALVLAALIWCAGQIVVALIKGRTLARGADRTGELLHQVDDVAVVGRDVLTELESDGKDVAIRDAVEQLGDPRGGVR
jgi:hypothetical protein